MRNPDENLLHKIYNEKNPALQRKMIQNTFRRNIDFQCDFGDHEFLYHRVGSCITRLAVNRAKTLDFLKFPYYLRRVQSLIIISKSLSDFPPISNISLLHLKMHSSDIEDLEFIKADTLTVLSLDKNNISDLTSLQVLPNLRSLSLKRNKITDVSHLSNFPNLRFLGLVGNPVTDLSPLNNLVDKGLKISN